MRYLLATDSVHTTAAACDYLQERAGPDDGVRVVHVQADTGERDSSSPRSTSSREDAGDARDGREALNVATVRLGAVTEVETEQRSGSPAVELLAAAAEFDADEIVLGVHGGEPGAESAVGSTARAVLGDADRPVVVVPQEEL
ncbi:universal stress protein [Natronoarchaeum rubrum]|uniref:universal stress protein n=1 Tax=Natronoarchaeum rubrum TaxID=755311 RepID=UPI002111A1D1|nr:universal stress protein [Natronoarchaeum rubrum]